MTLDDAARILAWAGLVVAVAVLTVGCGEPVALTKPPCVCKASSCLDRWDGLVSCCVEVECNENCKPIDWAMMQARLDCARKGRK
jgi:hypothetical protein